MTNFEKQQLEKMDKIISLLSKDKGDKKEEKTLKLEDHNFRINSDGWHKITKDGKSYLENQEKDVWEFLEGECKGEQLFTYDAAIRETKKAGKVMPTDEKLTELLKTKEDLKNVIYPGYRGTGGSFNYIGFDFYLWSSTPNGASGAWARYLTSNYSTVNRYIYTRAYGFSVRCLK